MISYDRYILGVTLLLMLAISSADIYCKMKSGCSTQCDPIGWNNIEEHLFDKEFSITCRNNEDDKLREEFKDLKTESKKSKEEYQNLKNLLLVIQEKHSNEIKELNTENKKSKEEYHNLKNLFLVIQEKHSNEIEDLESNHKELQNKISDMEIENKVLKDLSSKMLEKYDKDITNMNKTISDLKNALTPLLPTGCHEVKKKSGIGGVFDIYYLNSQIEVVCDVTTDGGKWTVFQRRFDGSQNFNQDWKNYVEGFGSFAGEFWLGLEKMHLLTQTGQYELRIEMTNKYDRVVIAKYQTFSISGSSNNYRLNIGKFSGTGVGDSLTHHNNTDFTTTDDQNINNNCDIKYGGRGVFRILHDIIFYLGKLYPDGI